MSRTGYKYINMKSAAVSTGTLTANIIYRLCRDTESFVAPNYDTDADLACAGVHGIRFQNRTVGKMYIWYGEVPTAQQNATTFKASGIEIAAGDYFEPPHSQIGLCYMVFESPASGYVHHLSH